MPPGEPAAASQHPLRTAGFLEAAAFAPGLGPDWIVKDGVAREGRLEEQRKLRSEVTVL